MGKRRALRPSGSAEILGDRKRRKNPAVSSSGSDDDDNGEIRLDSVVEHDDMQMTFEFNDMREIYSEGVTTLLRWFLPSHEAYELACVICNQGEVGTAINVEESDDTFGFATLLPFTGTKDTGIVSKIINEVRSVVAGSSSSSGILMHEHFSLSNLQKTLMMLHARFSNLPLELIAPLFRNIEHDLEWVQHSENTAVAVSTAEHFNGTEHVLLICPCSFSEESKVKIPGGGCIDICGSSDVLFDNFEDETFLEECAAAVLYQSQGLKKTLAAILIPASKLKKCTNTLHDMLPQQAESVASSSTQQNEVVMVESAEEGDNMVMSDAHEGLRNRSSKIDETVVSTYTVCIPDDIFDESNRCRKSTPDLESAIQRSTSEYNIQIEHRTLTSVIDVGLQVWRGAFLLADYIICNKANIKGQILFELGCGTGILGTIVDLCGHSKPAFYTDCRPEIVAMAASNIKRNMGIARKKNICVRVLDWSSDWNPRMSLPPVNEECRSHSDTSWTVEDFSLLNAKDESVLFLAADVIYDDELSALLFLKAAELMKPGEIMWLSLEKRYNFSMDDKTIVATGYSMFLSHLVPLTIDEAPGGESTQEPQITFASPHSIHKVYFEGNKIPLNFPQRIIDYDRVQDLEIWAVELKEWLE